MVFKSNYSAERLVEEADIYARDKAQAIEEQSREQWIEHLQTLPPDSLTRIQEILMSTTEKIKKRSNY